MSRNIRYNIDLEKSPVEYLDAINAIESEMEDKIHDLVWKYGKEKVRKDGKSCDYVLRCNSISTKDGNIPTLITKAIVLCPADCQVRGHLLFKDEDGETLSFLNLRHQQFNILSNIQKICEKIQAKEDKK